MKSWKMALRQARQMKATTKQLTKFGDGMSLILFERAPSYAKASKGKKKLKVDYLEN